MELLINYCREEEHSAATKPTKLCLFLKSFYSPVRSRGVNLQDNCRYFSSLTFLMSLPSVEVR